MANLQEAELHAVFVTCGITDQATRAQMVTSSEGFINLASLGKLETDIDVNEMARRTASRTSRRRMSVSRKCRDQATTDSYLVGS
jgi:hypothetical protein